MAPKATKLTKALKAMKNLGYSEKIVRPIVGELLELYDHNWILIEDEKYRVLIDAILESEEQKANSSEMENLMNGWSEDEAKEEEPLLKRPKRSNQQRGKSTFEEHHDKDKNVSKYYHDKGKSISTYPRSGIVVKQEKGTKYVFNGERDKSKSMVPFLHLGSSEDESDSNRNISEKRMIVCERGNRKRLWTERGVMHENVHALVEKVIDEEEDEAALCTEPLYCELPGFSVPLAVVPPDSPVLLLQGSSNENGPDAKENHSVSPEVIDLDADDICTAPCLLLKDAYSIENSCNVEGNHAKSTNNEKIEAENNENNVQDLLNLDVASSSKGEVKIFLTISFSLRSNFDVPSLEALFKKVEEQCLKSCKIPQTGFSMSKLMTEVCESFLIGGTTSAHTEDVRSETGPAGDIDNRLSPYSKSTISNDPITNRIPRSVGSVHLDFSRCNIYLSETERNIMELSSCVPSSKKTFLQKQRSYHTADITNGQESNEISLINEINEDLGPTFHYTADITNGQESNEISLINEINDDQGLTFNYISKNVIYHNANVRFFLVRIPEEKCCSNCFGDCFSLQIPCNCAGKSVSEFAYTPGGLLKETFLDTYVLGNDFVQQRNLFYCQDCPLERPSVGKLSVPCYSHITRKFIKECWYKCGCTMKCGNRVVQRGITAKLQQKGWGLRTLEDLPKGSFICEYVGEVVTTKELFERDMRKNGDSQTYSVLLDAGWCSKGTVKDEEALCLDATVYGNVARFINHRCFDANLVDIPVEVETPDHHYYHLAFFTKRKVNALEELTWDYGLDFNQTDFECRCRRKLCRYRKSVKRKLISHEPL